jgi:hypothetical protein
MTSNVDHDVLRLRAELAEESRISIGTAWDGGPRGQMISNRTRFVDYCSPKRILALLSEIKDLKDEVEEWKAYANHEGRRPK